MIFGLLPADASIQLLLEKLRDAGVTEDRLAVISSVPLCESVSPGRAARPALHVITFIAGLVGIVVGLFVAGGTAALYPIMTGGKPIVAIPVVAIISYETMMLVAILTTFVTMLIRSYRARRLKVPHHPRIHDGYIGLVCHIEEDMPQATTVTNILKRAGAVEVRVE